MAALDLWGDPDDLITERGRRLVADRLERGIGTDVGPSTGLGERLRQAEALLAVKIKGDLRGIHISYLHRPRTTAKLCRQLSAKKPSSSRQMSMLSPVNIDLPVAID